MSWERTAQIIRESLNSTDPVVRALGALTFVLTEALFEGGESIAAHTRDVAVAADSGLGDHDDSLVARFFKERDQ